MAHTDRAEDHNSIGPVDRPRMIGWVVLVGLIDTLGLAVAAGLVAIPLAFLLAEAFPKSAVAANGLLSVMFYAFLAAALITLIVSATIALDILAWTRKARRRALVLLSASLPAWLLLIITFAAPRRGPGEYSLSLGSDWIIAALIIAFTGILPSTWALIYLSKQSPDVSRTE